MKPEPVAKQTVCTACGLDWARHKPTRGRVNLSECVRLLKDELSKRPSFTVSNMTTGGTVHTFPTTTTATG